MGGIVWRIAIHALGIEHACDVLISSDMVLPSLSTRYSSVDDNSSFSELETLSTPELEFIVGTYYVYTDKGEQVSKQSWWPPYHIWKRSGCDAGQWTETAEEWFHKQLAVIRENPSIVLKSPSKWDNHLKFDVKSL
jgi:hypothetical protein